MSARRRHQRRRIIIERPEAGTPSPRPTSSTTCHFDESVELSQERRLTVGGSCDSLRKKVAAFSSSSSSDRRTKVEERRDRRLRETRRRLHLPEAADGLARMSLSAASHFKRRRIVVSEEGMNHSMITSKKGKRRNYNNDYEDDISHNFIDEIKKEEKLRDLQLRKAEAENMKLAAQLKQKSALLCKFESRGNRLLFNLNAERERSSGWRREVELLRKDVSLLREERDRCNRRLARAEDKLRVHTNTTTLSSKEILPDIYENLKQLLEKHLECSICNEIFIGATVLSGCGHTFCADCIRRWTSCKNNCPICRNTSGSGVPCLALDSYITKFTDHFYPDSAKHARQQVLEERTAASQQCVPGAESDVAETTTDDEFNVTTTEEGGEEEEDDESDNSNSTSDDDGVSPSFDDLSGDSEVERSDDGGGDGDVGGEQQYEEEIPATMDSAMSTPSRDIEDGSSVSSIGYRDDFFSLTPTQSEAGFYSSTASVSDGAAQNSEDDDDDDDDELTSSSTEME